MDFLQSALMVGITFPISYYLARGCLRGVLRIFRIGAEHLALHAGPSRRNVL